MYINTKYSQQKYTFSRKNLLSAALGLTIVLAPFTAQAASGSSYEVNNTPVTTLSDTVDIGFRNSVNGVLYNNLSPDNNTIKLSNGSDQNPYYVFGGLSVSSVSDASSINNTIILDKGRIETDVTETNYSGSVTAGLAYAENGANATASLHTITISSLTQVDGALTAGWAIATAGNGIATANNNTINMNGGKVSGDYGLTAGWVISDQGAAIASYNTVNFVSGTLDNSGSSAFAAWAETDSGSATGSYNSFIISGGDIASDIGVGAAWVGTNSGSATASFNSTTMSGGTITGRGISSGILLGALYGGYAQAIDVSGSATANSNIISMDGGTLDNSSLVGGAAILDLSVDNGYSTAMADNNSVIMSSGDIIGGGEIYGGWGRVHNGPGNVVIQSNTVTMSGGTLSGGGNVYGGWARVSSSYNADGNATVSDNTATVNGGTINDTGNLYGGYAQGYSGQSSANNNASNLITGTVSGSIYGGYARASDGSAISNTNTVNISGGTAGANVYGGYARISNTNGVATATGNILNISGGTVNGDIYGGYVFSSVNGGTLNATNNIINLQSDRVSGDIYGGYALLDSTIQNDFAQTIVGNTLNTLVSNVNVNSVQHFENYGFLLPETSGQSLLNSTTAIALSGNNGAWQSNVNLIGVAGTQPLAPGYTATLISNVDTGNTSFKINGQTFDATSNNTIKNVKQGHSLAYNFVVNLNANQLQASLATVDVSENAKILAASRLANIGLLTQSTDFVVSNALSNAKLAATTAINGSFVPFAASNIASLRQNIGSNIDMSGVSMLTGISRQTGSLLTGYFIETGWSSYKTNDSYEGASATGKGHANYYGLGMLLNKDLANNYYTQASVRIGRVSAGYDNPTLKGSVGSSASYHTNSTYYVAHLGLGKKYQLANNNELDIFARYLFTHQSGNNIIIAGDPFQFDALNSHRLQLGSKILFDSKKQTSYYVGLTYEYEFSGNAPAAVYGRSISTAGLKGSTGILDIGLRLKPSKTSSSTIDLGLQGYVGKRQGIAGNVQVKFGF